VLEGLELKEKTVAEAVNEIVQKSMELGFISREKENIILISTAVI